jgi:hypothetical protein
MVMGDKHKEQHMMDRLVSMKDQLSDLAAILNAFKSEAVQLRILDLFFGKESVEDKIEQPEAGGTTRKVHARRATKVKKAGSVEPGKRKKAPSGSGAPGTLTQLLSGTFFEKPRTINDVIEHCKHNLARTFKANEFSGKLGRMVRAGELTRKKNADMQYEYKKP